MEGISRIGGVIAVLPTPFNVDGEVDHNSLARVVDTLILRGVHGLATLALHGEGYKLTEKERKAVVRTVVETTACRVPVVVNVGHESTHVAIQQACDAADLSADAITVLPPSLVKPTYETMIEYFIRIANAVEIPLILQDTPQLTGVEMPLEFIKTLYGEAPNILYAKIEGLPAGHKISFIVEALGPGFGVFCGWGGLEFFEALHRGACGCMPAAEFGPALARVYEQFKAGEIDRARALFDDLQPVIGFASRSLDRFVILSKTILARKGLIATPMLRHPYTPLDETEWEIADRLLDEAEIL
jgi:4-hydroxy-tetrahydrodipicolinate synthase